MTRELANARRVSAPLVVIETADYAAAMLDACESLATEKIDGVDIATPKLAYDIVGGVRGLNEEGVEVESVFKDEEGDDETKGNPLAFVVKCSELPPTAMIFFVGADDWIEDDQINMGIWKLRDEFKADRRMIVLLGHKFTLPRKLERDVVTIREPLPTREQLREIVTEQVGYTEIEVDDETIDRAVSAVQGLSAFGAEQSTAMSLRRDGLNIEQLWNEKRELIERTPGLQVWRGDETFDDVGGLDNAKGYIRKVINGKRRPDAIIWIDEIEKMFSGSRSGQGDTSGVSQDFLAQILSNMENTRARGFIFVGHPGGGKSFTAKATGGEAGCPTIQLDLGSMKGSLVGESEKNLRGALDIISAVSNDNALWIATCNSRTDLPPELIRRFTFGTIFFDLPDDAERASIWKHWKAAFKLKAKSPTSNGWTGAEIRNCCQYADAMECTLEEASEYIIPYSVSDKANVERLRNEANGRFLSASYPGVFQAEKRKPLAKSPRKIG